jgi:predicted transcriptional regulator
MTARRPTPKPRLPMGELEAQVLDVLWEADDWLTPGDVHAVLSTKRPLAYTTVMTILVRLWNKGTLERRREGRAYAYHPIQTAEERAADRMNELLDDVADRSTALAHFLDGLPPAERARLRRILSERRR